MEKIPNVGDTVVLKNGLSGKVIWRNGGRYLLRPDGESFTTRAFHVCDVAGVTRA